MLILAFTSCKKDPSNTETQATKVEITDADRAVVNRILKFRSRLEHKKAYPMLKSNEIVSIDDARLDVETNFNASYAFPDEIYINTSHETIVVKMPVTDATYTTVDNMLALYDECFAKVLETYNNSTIENKELVFVSLKKGDIVNNEQKLDLKVVLGTKQLPGQGWTPFVEFDNWKYGNYWGKCDGTQLWQSDAAEQIEQMLYSYRPIYIPCPGCRYVWVVDEANQYFLEGNEYNDANNNNLMFYIDKTDALTDIDICLDYNEMNYHFNGHFIVIWDLMRATYNKPSNWEFMAIDVIGEDASYDIGDEHHNRIRHKSYIDFGYRYLVEPEIELEAAQSLSNFTE